MVLCLPADSSLAGKTQMKMNSAEHGLQEAKAELQKSKKYLARPGKLLPRFEQQGKG